MDLKQFQNKPKNDAEMFALLMANAFEGVHMKFEFLRCWEHCKVARIYLNGLRHVIKFFKSAQKVNKAIIAENEKQGKIDLEAMLMSESLKLCIDYYKKELRIAKDMLSEYREYICSGHIIDTFILPRWRPDEECVDYRTLPGVFMFKKPR